MMIVMEEKREGKGREGRGREGKGGGGRSCVILLK
jgi:hypothetical protein